MNNQPNNQPQFDNQNIPSLSPGHNNPQNRPGAQAPLPQFYTPSFEQPPAKNNNAMLLGICGAALLLSAGGLIYNMTKDPAQEKATPAVKAATDGVESIFAAQARMMNQAMDMAKQAREMQRENRERMEKAMRECEEGGPADDGHLRFPSER